MTLKQAVPEKPAAPVYITKQKQPEKPKKEETKKEEAKEEVDEDFYDPYGDGEGIVDKELKKDEANEVGERLK